MANYSSRARRGKNKALLVGCNYQNTSYELRGCHNDVAAMRATLFNVFRFDSENIEVLMDKPGTKGRAMPTGANIMRALTRLITHAREGDVLFFHFSGHGTRIPPSKSNSKYVEAIVPCDYSVITCMDFRKLVDRVPTGATFIILADSCHSGGLIDKEEEQIGPNHTQYQYHHHHQGPLRQISFQNGRVRSYCKPKMIPYESLLPNLSYAGGGLNDTPDIADHGSPMSGDVGPYDMSTGSVGPHHMMHGVRPSGMKIRARSELPQRSGHGILLSACQSDEVAMDIKPDNLNQYCGAFSHAVQVIVNEKILRGPCSNKEIVVTARDILKTRILKDFPEHNQHPCLYCSKEHVNAIYLRNVAVKGG